MFCFKNIFNKLFLTVFIFTACIFFAPVNTYASQYAKTSSRLNIRSGPSTSDTIYKVLNIYSVLNILEEQNFNGWTKISHGKTIGYVNNEFIYNITEDEALNGNNSSSFTNSPVELLSWNEVKGIFVIGVDTPVYDIYSGKTYNLRTFSNGQHADVETITPNDTAILKETFGGVWTWTPRPVLVNINGRSIAASINGMPHASGTNPNNNMNGQICLHFHGSYVHNGNASFAKLHQNILLDGYNISK